MSRSNGRKKQQLQHVHTLVPSLPDDACLVKAVEDRFLDLCHAWLRIKGVELPIPKSLDADMLRWRQMRCRHKQGDLRHTEAELHSTRTVAQWTVDTNASLRNQTPVIIKWD